MLFISARNDWLLYGFLKQDPNKALCPHYTRAHTETDTHIHKEKGPITSVSMVTAAG